MVASNIKVYLRVRPCAKQKISTGFQADYETGAVRFEVPKDTPAHEVNNSKTSYAFRFDGILSMSASQVDILNSIAKPVIEDVLSGVNGTIFAYGQTGSGKTFTITGSPQRYEDRGLIPRTLDYLFEHFKKGSAQYRMYISYLEIYNDVGYDLLRDDSAGKLEDLPKVVLREDEDGNTHLRNLSVNLAATKEDALNLLFIGDTNRVVAETPMNDASTRSHCLFIIWIDSTQSGSDVVRRSKLHLVDLAGSERISRTRVEGTLLKEATAINLSLHYLAQVIEALHARAKGGTGHVPYRNSMMTSVLRDSLGGNCKTTMIGCVAVEPSNIDESISTCRFAARVAQITNNARVNEELDPNLLITRLRREVAELKEEVKVARGGENGEPEALTSEDVEKCRALVLQYVSKSGDSKEPFVCGSVERLRASFRILRDLCQGALTGGGGEAATNGGVGGGGSNSAARKAAMEAEVQRLRLEVAQRDEEIRMLMQMRSKQRGGDSRPFISSTAPVPPAAPPPAGGTAAAMHMGSSLTGTSAAAASMYPQTAADQANPAMRSHSPVADAPPPRAAGAAPTPTAADAAPREAERPRVRNRIPGERGPPVKLPPGVDAAELLLDRQKAFEVFRSAKNEPESRDLQENKAALRDKIEQAKAFGEEANRLREGINGAKTRLERLRAERAMTAADGSSVLEDGPEELREVQEIDRLKAGYRERMDDLRKVKSDIAQREVHIKAIFEQQRIRQQREFETWFAGLRRETSVENMDEEKKRELYERIIGTNANGGGKTDGDATRSGCPAVGPPPSLGGGKTPGGSTDRGGHGTASARADAAGVAAPTAAMPARTVAASGWSTSAAAARLPSEPQPQPQPPSGRASTPSRTADRPSPQAAPIPERPSPHGGTQPPAHVQLDEQPPWARTPATGAVAAAAAQHLPIPGSSPVTSTGDASTDADIAAYFAALGSLAKSS